MNIRRLKGFKDILPGETEGWQRIEQVVRQVFGGYGFDEIRLPLLEDTRLFSRSIGEATDIVEKEMYTFTDTGGDSVTLRPEGTASAVRAYVENGYPKSDPKTRMFYFGPMFRRERPQKGRFRQFHQIGAECFGWKEPEADADVICLLWDFFAELGLGGRVSLAINSLGCADDRGRYVERLKQFLIPRSDKLCDNCRNRIERNPLRVIDCKSSSCQEAIVDAPSIGESWCDDCSENFNRVKECLDVASVPFKVEPRMVRGLDYYNRTTFELLSGDLGAQNAVAGGGRYDGLVSTLGGPDVPALGFAIGVERLVLLVAESLAADSRPLVYFVHTTPTGLDKAMELRRELVKSGGRGEIDFEKRSIKAQMKAANRMGARFAFILGEDELARGEVAVKDLGQGEQNSLTFDKAIVKALEAHNG